MKKILPLVLIIVVVVIFFWQFLLKGLLPIPSDTIVGLYYPFRDAYFKTNPNGLPYKNFLITDPVRQQFPWKKISVDSIKTGNLPTWNPYNFAGTPLLANFQSAVFYPLNVLFFLLPFESAWGILILLEPLLAAVFLFLYLNNLKIKREASLFGALVFSFSGFSVAWMQWGTIVHTALWLPLILLSIDKIFENKKIKNLLFWFLVFVCSLSFSLFAGHLQIFVYVLTAVLLYAFGRLLIVKNKLKIFSYFSILFLIFLAVTFIQWFPAIKFILLSARNLDLVGWKDVGWFIPWQNLIQFIAPDFFGNPATLNYFGIWNYGEFIGYIGIMPLILAFFALFFRKDKKTLFFGLIFFCSLIFALPTVFAKLPFKFNLPFLSTAQPTRLLFLTDFSLSILTALGLDYLITLKSKKKILYILGLFSIFFVLLWGFVLIYKGGLISLENLKIAKQNLIVPSVLFIISLLLITVYVFFAKIITGKQKMAAVLIYGFIILTVIDLFRFGWKFEPFTIMDYLFPKTSITDFLESQKQPFRIMATDSRILPPNFSIMYKLQTLDGYDPLYLQRYGELMAASGRGIPDISPPFGFNRIITPQDPLSKISDLLGVKYILSLEDLKYTKLKPVFSDGFVKVYENTFAFPRAFFINNTLIVKSKQEAINAMFQVNYQLNSRAVVENVVDNSLFKSSWDIGQVNFVNYSDEKVLLKTKNSGDGFLILTDSFYPSWHATIDGQETKIYLTDFNFRGIIVPKGEHVVEFYNQIF